MLPSSNNMLEAIVYRSLVFSDLTHACLDASFSATIERENENVLPVNSCTSSKAVGGINSQYPIHGSVKVVGIN